MCIRDRGYYVADSGGKDSACVLALCKMAGVRFDSHYNITTVDPPELVKFEMCIRDRENVIKSLPKTK